MGKPKNLTAEEQRAAEDALILMPRSIRDKLDAVGIKLRFAEWEQLPMSERERLRDAPCSSVSEVSAYRDQLEDMIRRFCGKEPERLG